MLDRFFIHYYFKIANRSTGITVCIPSYTGMRIEEYQIVCHPAILFTLKGSTKRRTFHCTQDSDDFSLHDLSALSVLYSIA